MMTNDLTLPTTEMKGGLTHETWQAVYAYVFTDLALNAEGLIPPDDWGAIYISTDPNCADTTRFQ